MALASLDDINVHLPEDKLEVFDAEDEHLQIDCDRIIKGWLAGTYSAATLAAWTTPATTPSLIRAVAGRFMAAFVYKKAYSEDSTRIPPYAQMKYDEAMTMLNMIKDGQLLLSDVVEVPGTTFTGDLFWPNDDTDAPKFTMSLDF